MVSADDKYAARDRPSMCSNLGWIHRWNKTLNHLGILNQNYSCTWWYWLNNSNLGWQGTKPTVSFLRKFSWGQELRPSSIEPSYCLFSTKIPSLFYYPSAAEARETLSKGGQEGIWHCKDFSFRKTSSRFVQLCHCRAGTNTAGLVPPSLSPELWWGGSDSGAGVDRKIDHSNQRLFQCRYGLCE